MQLSPASSHFQISRVSKHRPPYPVRSHSQSIIDSLCTPAAANNTDKEQVYGSKKHVLSQLFYMLRPFLLSFCCIEK
jgi:hypothetical protein